MRIWIVVGSLLSISVGAGIGAGIGHYLDRPTYCEALRDYCKDALDSSDVGIMFQCSIVNISTPNKTETSCESLLNALKRINGGDA